MMKELLDAAFFESSPLDMNFSFTIVDKILSAY